MLLCASLAIPSPARLECIFVCAVCRLSLISFVVASLGVETMNPLECRDNYSATSNNVKLAVDGWAVTFGTVRRRQGATAARPVSSSRYQM